MDRPLEEGANTPETWLAEHGGALLAYALRRVGQIGVAEDLVQETLLAALRGHTSYAGQASVQTWLIAILRRKIVDHFRSQARREQLLDNASQKLESPFDEQGYWRKAPRTWPQLPTDSLESAEFLAILAQCIENLGPTLGPPLRMRAVEQLTTEEICSLLDISPTNLSVRLNRARGAVRLCLEANWLGND